MRTVEFRRLFDDKNAARVRFELKRNRVLRFVVQLECRFNDEWHPVVRYDTAHNFAHRDVLHPSGKTEKTELAIQDYNEALTFAINDLADNWENYRRRYEQWLKQK
jgi:hypothetical protein